MPRYNAKQNENYYTINRNLGKILSFFYMLWSPISPLPLSLYPLISLLPLFLPSPVPYNSPSSPQLPLLLPQPFTPLIYHDQSDSITHPPLNYNATATPPSLLINYHHPLFDGDQK